ncbi:MAG: YvcK family protein, partial [Candidatus Omnitrophica bacterium]|nr:YvcK family protein [Candidatus Omnitrophota bacterium]
PAHCRAAAEAIQAIEEAEAIVLGPGSLYTSIIPNLLVKDIREAVNRSLALKIYACNVMTQFGETDQYTAADHVNALLTHGGLTKVDYCIVNTAEVPASILNRYEKERAYPVLMNSAAIRELNCEVIEEEVISTLNYVRHDPEKLAKIIIDTMLDARYA